MQLPGLDPLVLAQVHTQLSDHPALGGHLLQMALDGGTDGLNFYRRIASDAPKFLLPGGVLLLEVGFDQAEAVMALLADFADVQAHEDYQHIPRMIEARKHV